MNNKIKLYLGRIALVLTASVSAFVHRAEAAGLGTGVLTLEDADVSESMAWKSGFAPTTVRIPLRFEDVFGNAISGYDATFQLGGTSGNTDVGYVMNATGTFVAPWVVNGPWFNPSVISLVGKRTYHPADGADEYVFDHTLVSVDGGNSWKRIQSDDPHADIRYDYDLCCWAQSSLTPSTEYGWRVCSRDGINRILDADQTQVQFKFIYQKRTASKGKGTLALVDGFGGDWKKTQTKYLVHVNMPLVLEDEAGNPIDGFDATLKIGGVDGAPVPGAPGLWLDASGTIIRNIWSPDDGYNASIVSLANRKRYRGSDNTIYEFVRAKVSDNYGASWKDLYTQTTPAPERQRDDNRYDLALYSPASQSDYHGWTLLCAGYTSMRSIEVGDEGKYQFKFTYRVVMQGDGHTLDTLGNAEGLKFRLFNYDCSYSQNNVNSNGLSGFFDFRGIAPYYAQNPEIDLDGFYPNHATVMPTLDPDGFPVFDGRGDPNFVAKTGGTGTASLRYLFDTPTGNTKGVSECYVTNTLLVYDKATGNYSYNSQKNACDYDAELNRFRVRDYNERTSNVVSYITRDYVNTYYDFLPFTYWDGKSEYWSPTRDGLAWGRVNYLSKDAKFWFGYSLEFSFAIPQNGVDDSNSTFTFSGDDDVWVFVDDVLVLDLGGTHGTCTGKLDLRTGEIKAYFDFGGQDPDRSYPTTLVTRFSNAGRTPTGGWDDESSPKTFKNGTIHTLKMFYLDRGAEVSNCNLDFNLVVVPEHFTMPKSLWITDHEDAGTNRVHLAFMPDFGDEEINLESWIHMANAEKRIKVAFADKESFKVPARVVPLRDGFGTQDIDKGWVWVTVDLPEDFETSDGTLKAKIIIDGTPDREESEDAVEKVSVTELMASNGETLATVSGQKGLDWIELRNDGDLPIDVSGWYLSDNPDDPPAKWAKIEGKAVVPAHGTLIVWADKDFAGFTEGEAYTRIGLSTDGESLVLADADGIQKTRIDFPRQIKDVSYGVTPEGAWGYFQTATPRGVNADTVLGDITPQVVFSEPHGYKTEGFDLSLSIAGPEQRDIYYTTDGTSPTAKSCLYSTPIHVDRTTCVRAAVVDEQSVLQDDTAATYIFLDDVLAQSAEAPEGFPADRTVNNHRMVYGMNLPAAGSEDARRLLKGFTNSIATLSFVIDPKALFDEQTGIYANPDSSNEGKEWERKVMVEQIDPVRGAINEFSIPAGLRLRGAHSRTVEYPKHSFRLFFRSAYGAGSLDFPLFGDEGKDSFEKVDLRTSQNYSWANENAWYDSFVNEVFARDSQRDLGEPYTRSRYYHLFINGQYWGLYQTQERGDEDYAETYYKADAADYDVVKTVSPSGNVEASEGNLEAWTELWRLAVSEGVSGDKSENYWRLQGRNPDGTRNETYPILLDPQNLMDYMLVSHYMVDGDCPVSYWGGKPNNLYALRCRRDGAGKRDGFFFLQHDAEISMGTDTPESALLPYEDYRREYCKFTDDPTGYGNDYDAHTDYSVFEKFNPAELHCRLCANDDYRMAFADRFYQTCLKTGGVFTVEAASARFRARMAEIDDAIVCEAARWARQGQTRETWLDACEKCLTFIANRLTNMTQQYRNRGWYPSIDAPVIARADGTPFADGEKVESGAQLRLTGSGTLYYTLDGSDPRASGGAVSAQALAVPADGLVTLPNGKTTIRVRGKTDAEWSAEEQVTLIAPSENDLAVVANLRLAEVMSNPIDDAEAGSEYIVLVNRSPTAALDLMGVRLTCTKVKKGKLDGDPSVDIVLGAISLEAGASVTLTKADHWADSKITNGGVEIQLFNATGATAQTARIDTGWFGGACDGTGSAFQAVTFGSEALNESDWTAVAR